MSEPLAARLLYGLLLAGGKNRRTGRDVAYRSSVLELEVTG